MSKNTLEQELEAIKTITEALEPLDTETRQRALSYAIQRLGLGSSIPPQPSQRGQPEYERRQEDVSPRPETVSATRERVVDIRTLKEEKKPATDVEMVTLVAYYLKNLAQEDERKDEIGTEDIEKYFVQAGYPLPTEKRFALTNAKKAGYLESTSRGKYKINSVGHNLVAHSMPRSDSTGSVKPRKKRSKAKKTKKKVSKKKTSKKRTKKSK